ncbi:hypothetical protein E4U43_007904 [Claviceps pusilla]|uniref:Uncharacterized protein n=1 Tax=Claviceps pusilla TaxID=123648 RepID=A0A9P7NBT6_9HYPO|nr:hypothetical protein E4U43_007904 [Claviceps pusilla]
MRGPVSFVAVLSALSAAGAALPQIRVLPRAADGAPTPKYSVIPLEPGDDGKRCSSPSCVQTGKPVGVTKPAPTSVSIVPIAGKTNANTIIVTVTVHVTEEPTSREKATISATTTPAPSTFTTTDSPTLPTTTVTPSASRHVPSVNSTGTTCRHCTEGTATSLASISVTIITTATIPRVSRRSSSSMAITTTTARNTPLVTPPVVMSTSTRTCDDGTWHTTYPAWNVSAPHTRRRTARAKLDA